MNAKAKVKSEQTRKEEFEKANESAHEAYEKFMEAKEHMQSAARAAGVELKQGAKDQVDEVVGNVQTTSINTYDEVTGYIRENPVKSAGGAFLAGFVLSKVFK